MYKTHNFIQNNRASCYVNIILVIENQGFAVQFFKESKIKGIVWFGISVYFKMCGMNRAILWKCALKFPLEDLIANLITFNWLIRM